jgi:hypothetical protein
MLQDDSVPVGFGSSPVEVPQELPRSEVANIQQPQYQYRVTNPTGRGADEHWDDEREKVANSILTGNDTFRLRGFENSRPYLSLLGWGIEIIADFVLDDNASIYIAAEISAPGTKHERTCFESPSSRLRRLAFRIRIESESGESTFWGQRVRVKSVQLAEKLFDRLAMSFDSNGEGMRGERPG